MLIFSFEAEMTQGHVGKTASFSTDTIPAGRIGTEEDIAGMVLWVASRTGAYLNGTTILLDGGRLSLLPATY